MKIETELFGIMEIDKDKVLRFDEGIPGFNDEKEFIIIYNEDGENPLNWLQSIKTPELSFIIIDPFAIYDDYDFKLSKSIVNKLGIEDEKDIVVYTLITIPDDIQKMTTNLLAPIIINRSNLKAKQVILDEEKYTTKHFIFDQEVLEDNKKEVK